MVQLHIFKQPLAGWPKDPALKKVGQYMQVNCESGFEAYAMALLTRVLGMNNEEVRQIIAGAIRDLRDKKIHAWVRL